MQWIKGSNEKSLWFLWLPFVIAIGIWSVFHSTAIAETSIEDEEVRLIIHNWQDRPISRFTLNGMMGGNASHISITLMPLGWGRQPVVELLRAK